jgi:hypothetical protein
LKKKNKSIDNHGFGASAGILAITEAGRGNFPAVVLIIGE